MKTDQELDLWKQQWRSQPGVPADLVRRVEKGTRALRLARLGEILVTVIIGGWMTAWAAIEREPNIILLAAGTWVSIALAWFFSLRLSRNVWAAAENTAAAYVDLCIRRCRRDLEALRVFRGLGIPMTIFIVALDYRILLDRNALDTWSDYAIVAAATMIALGIVIGLPAARRGKVQAELESLLDLDRQLEEASKLDQSL